MYIHFHSLYLVYTCCYTLNLGLDRISGVWLEGDPRSWGCGHEVQDLASACDPSPFLVPRFGVGQVGSGRLRLVTQRVRVRMKPRVGHKGPEGVH